MKSTLTVDNHLKPSSINGENGEELPCPVKVQRSLSTVQTPYEIQAYNNSWLKATPFLQYRTSDFVYDLKQCSAERLENGFKHQLFDQWDSAREKKAFNYNLNCLYKLLDGEYDLSLQLNVERGTLRRKPMRFSNIRQPFNHLRWNFTKLKPNEILYMLRCLDKPYTNDKLDLHVMAVNASPLEKGHSLIIPSMNKCLPQVLNLTAVRMSVDLMLLVEDETFHLLFNSLLGQASVNHLHIHSLFWPYESDIINRKVEMLCSTSPPETAGRSVFILRRPTWFIHTFVFQLLCAADFDNFVLNLTNCANFLTNENVAHNLFMSRAPKLRIADQDTQDNDLGNDAKFVPVPGEPLYVTAYLYPRRNQTGAKPATSFCPASLELSGLLTAYTYRFFDSATEQTALRVIDEDAVLPEHEFDSLADELADRYEGRVPWNFSDADKQANLLSPTPNTRSSSLVDRRRWSHWSSSASEKLGSESKEAGSRNSIKKWHQKTNESLTSYELDELSDAFHTITSPIPLKHHHSFSSNSSCSGSPVCLNNLSQSKEGLQKSNSLDEEDS